MERLQITLLVLLFSAWFLTCKQSKPAKQADTSNQTAFDSSSLEVESRQEYYYSDWLSLPFSGSGSHWFATMHLPFQESVFYSEKSNEKLVVFVKNNNAIYKIGQNHTDSIIEQVVSDDLISISTNFYPEGFQFRYAIEPDGTFVNKAPRDMAYSASFR